MAAIVAVSDPRYECVRINLDTMESEVARMNFTRERAEEYARKINAMYKRNQLEFRVVVRQAE